MTSIFGFYYIVGLLGQMGWPKRRGLFNSEGVVSTLVLDGAVDQMIDWAASIGACRPKLALEILATVLRDNDWESKDSFDIVKSVTGSKPIWKERGNNNPKEVVKPFRFFKKDLTNLKDVENDVLSFKEIKDNRMREALEVYFMESLIWGLFNSDKYKEYFEKHAREQEKELPEYKEAGLGVDYIPSLEQMLKDGEEIIRGYEKEIRPLSPIPQKLLNDAKSLEIEINN